MSREKIGKKVSDLSGRIHETRIELTSNREALIEGCNCVLEYDDTLIRISAKKYEIKFTGDSLTLRCLNPENVVVSGKIFSIEFI